MRLGSVLGFGVAVWIVSSVSAADPRDRGTNDADMETRVDSSGTDSGTLNASVDDLRQRLSVLEKEREERAGPRDGWIRITDSTRLKLTGFAYLDGVYDVGPFVSDHGLPDFSGVPLNLDFARDRRRSDSGSSARHLGSA